jgi:hypothetical protein
MRFPILLTWMNQQVVLFAGSIIDLPTIFKFAVPFVHILAIYKLAVAL